jgi:hypothetical protein
MGCMVPQSFATGGNRSYPEFWTVTGDLWFPGYFTLTTSPEILKMKFAVNELSFPLVTHTAYSDAQFDSYGILMLGQGAEHFLHRLDIQANAQV